MIKVLSLWDKLNEYIMSSILDSIRDMEKILDSNKKNLDSINRKMNYKNIEENKVFNFTEIEQYKYEGKSTDRSGLDIKFSSLNNGTGNLEGLTLQEIVSVCGGFNRMVFINNQISCIWENCSVRFVGLTLIYVKFYIQISFDRNYKYLWVINQEGSMSNSFPYVMTDTAKALQDIHQKYPDVIGGS